MKIGILTYYSVHNHGALLQAYGMQRTLQKMGNEVDFLTFERNYENMEPGSEKKYKIGISSIPLYLKYMKDNGLGAFVYNGKKSLALNKFRKKFLAIGEEYFKCHRDAVCIGSDEVFSIEIGYNPFFYGLDVDAPCIFSYAGSFGPTTLYDVEQSHHKENIADGLRQMKSVSVRDNNSKKIVESLTDKEALLVCDPVILYGYEEEIRAIKKKKKPSAKYILLYSYDKNSNGFEEIRALREYAKRHGLKIYSVGYYHKWCDMNINVSPLDLFYYFCNAELVVTDTFHGTVLSLITNAEFVSLVRNNGNKLAFLLEQYCLENRIVKDYSELLGREMPKINYVDVNKIIEIERKKSREYLKNTLENINDKW